MYDFAINLCFALCGAGVFFGLGFAIYHVQRLARKWVAEAPERRAAPADFGESRESLRCPSLAAELAKVAARLERPAA